MSIKTILVQVNSDNEDNLHINAAIDIAVNFGAHLCGLYVMEDLNLPTYAGAYIPAGVLQAHNQAERDRAKNVESEFKAMVGKAGCTSEWNCVQGFTDQQINAYARYADLIVIGQSQEQSVLSNEISIEDHVLIESARPVLLIPYIGVTKSTAKRVLVAWSGTRESVRAVSDALPFLKQAESVEVVSVSKSQAQSDNSLQDICDFLKRHGVNAQAHQVVSKDISVADTILSRAADHNIDLIVMGAYGHSRLREYVFGGATHYMLKHMTVPVLMSH